jgi:hypothetical protein
MRRGLWGEFAEVTARHLANKILHLPICEPIGRSDINPRGGPSANPLRQHRIGQIRHAHPIFGLETMGLLARIQILPKTFNLIAEPLAGTKYLTRMELGDRDACVSAPSGNHILSNQHRILDVRGVFRQIRPSRTELHKSCLIAHIMGRPKLL